MHLIYEERNWNYRLVVVPIMLFFITFISWASLVEIDEIVRGEGKVIPTSQTKILQHLEGGIISEILVKEGDQVKFGQTIYRLNNIFFDANLRENEIQIMSLRAKLLRLSKEIESLENKGRVQLVFPQDIIDIIPNIVTNETNTYYADLISIDKQINVAKNKMRQKELKLDELQAKKETLEVELKFSNESMEIFDSLIKQKVISRKKYIEELTKKQHIITKITEVRYSLPIVRKEILELEERVEIVKYDKKSKLLQKYNEVDIELKKLKEKTKVAMDRNSRSEVMSPVNGIVNKLYFNTIGGIIKAGDKIAEITPIDDTLMIEAKIKASDRAFVWTEQKVNISITAYDSSSYGYLEGEIIYISSDSFTDSGNMGVMQGAYYIVKVKTDSSSLGENLPVLSGMVANINILTGKKTILKYIINPIKDILNKSLREH